MSHAVPAPDFRVGNVSAGRQSTTMSVLSREGVIDKLDFAIFGDTGWESKAVYDQLNALDRYLGEAGIPIHRASAGDLKHDVLDPLVYATLPCWTKEGRETRVPVAYTTCPTCRGFRLIREDEERCADCEGQGQVPTSWEWRPSRGRIGSVIRQCTAKYKVEPIGRKLRELMGAKVWDQPCRYCDSTGRRIAPWDPSKREGPCSVCRGTASRRRVDSPPPGLLVEQWIGFSADEVERVTTAGFPSYVRPRFPLLELNWTVAHCIEWLAERGWTGVPRSTCLGCPFHDDDTWLEIADNHPAVFAELVLFDRSLRARGTGMQADRFLNERRKPLDEAVADYRTEKADRGDQDVLWPEYRPKRKVRHCNPFGCASVEVEQGQVAPFGMAS